VVTQQEFDEVEMRRTVAVKELERALQKRAQVRAKDRPGEKPGRRGEGDARLDAGGRPFAGVIVENGPTRGRWRPRRSSLRPGRSGRLPHRGVGFRDIPAVVEKGTPVLGVLDADPGNRSRPSSRRSSQRSTRRAARSREGGPSRWPGPVGPVREAALRGGEGDGSLRSRNGPSPARRLRRRVHDRRPGQPWRVSR